MIGVPLLLLAAVTLEQRLTERSLRLTSRKVIDAQERERQLIAQELHDDVAGTLTLAEIELDRMIAGERPQPPPAALNKVRDQLTAISQAIWELSHGLYPSNLEYLGLVHALKRMCADLADETQIELDCEVTDIPERLPPDVSLCLYRVAQEALKNIVRHSQAKHASVRLLGNHQRLLLQIDDDGVGFNQSGVVSGLGFSSMCERLKAVHGGVQIDSAPNQGTRLEAWVMLRQAS
jgi:signal transduction histidine kinase